MRLLRSRKVSQLLVMCVMNDACCGCGRCGLRLSRNIRRSGVELLMHHR